MADEKTHTTDGFPLESYEGPNLAEYRRMKGERDELSRQVKLLEGENLALNQEVASNRAGWQQASAQRDSALRMGEEAAKKLTEAELRIDDLEVAWRAKHDECYATLINAQATHIACMAAARARLPMPVVSPLPFQLKMTEPE